MSEGVESRGARPSVSLVLETNNLAGADRAVEMARLTALMRRLRAQTIDLRSLRELVLTHGGLTEAEQAGLGEAAGAPLCFVELAAETGYYAAKNRGFLATSAEVVAFGDADCWPDPRWLEELVRPFARDARVAVVAGKTVYKDSVLGAASTAVDFLFWEGPLGGGTVRNFYANNVAFRREVFAEMAYPHAADLHRGNCTLLGIALGERGIAIHLAPEARTLHPLPVGRAAHLRFRLRRGEDAAELTGPLLEAYLPAPLAGLRVPTTAASLAILGARLGYGLRAVAREQRGLRAAACAGAVTALSAADALGALARGAGIRAAGSRDEDAPLEGWE
jgi:hypothetical protein